MNNQTKAQVEGVISQMSGDQYQALPGKFLVDASAINYSDLEDAVLSIDPTLHVSHHNDSTHKFSSAGYILVESVSDSDEVGTIKELTKDSEVLTESIADKDTIAKLIYKALVDLNRSPELEASIIDMYANQTNKYGVTYDQVYDMLKDYRYDPVSMTTAKSRVSKVLK